MDIISLTTECKKFLNLCKERGFPISHACLAEAYEGDPTTSFILHLKGDWIENMECFPAIEIMTNIMWESMSFEARTKIFSIKIYDEDKKLHCASGPLMLIYEENAA